MAHDITVRVTPDSLEPSGFKWEYSHDGVDFFPLGPDSNLFNIEIETDPEIVVTLEAHGQPGDTCVFLSPDVTFKDKDGNTPSPNPFSTPSRIDSSTVSFTDDNTSPPAGSETFHVKFFATYNDGSSESSIASPDPTIVNVGTDQPPTEWPSRERPEPAGAGV